MRMHVGLRGGSDGYRCSSAEASALGLQCARQTWFTVVRVSLHHGKGRVRSSRRSSGGGGEAIGECGTGAMARNDCLTRVVAGVGVGGAVGGALGAVYGTYEAFRYKIPGMLKVRHVGQTTLGSAAVFGLFLGAGSLIQCGKNY